MEVQSIAIAPTVDPATGLTSLNSTINLRMYVVQKDAKLTGAAARTVTTTTPRATNSPSPSPSPTGTRTP
jgi:hypothetical protein